jgi:uncharacterized protein (DUF1330 family)
MKAYLVANVEVADADAYEPYRREVPALIERHGGRYLARGGAIEVLEGNPDYSRLVIVEFPTLDAARNFYGDPDYQRIMTVRIDNAASSIVIAHGVPA